MNSRGNVAVPFCLLSMCEGSWLLGGLPRGTVCLSPPGSSMLGVAISSPVNIQTQKHSRLARGPKPFVQFHADPFFFWGGGGKTTAQKRPTKSFNSPQK